MSYKGNRKKWQWSKGSKGKEVKKQRGKKVKGVKEQRGIEKS